MLQRTRLHQYQNRAVEFIKEKKRCALFLGVGLGKSITSLTAISDLIEDFAFCRVLIIAPLRVCNSVWVQEAQKWEHTLGLKVNICTGSVKERKNSLDSEADIYIINRENVKWLVDNYQRIWKWQALFIDESSSFKSHSSQRFKALKSVLHLTEYMVLLTATPASNGYMDLWSQIYLIDKGAALGKNITAYRNRFFSKFGFKYTINKGAKDIIQDLIKDFTLSMTAEDYLELPECISLYNSEEFNKKLYSQYKSFADSLVLEYEEDAITAMNTAVLTNKLMQFANGAIYDEDKQARHIHDLKIEMLKDIKEENQDEPLLVAYTFKSDLIRLVKAFPDAVVLDKDSKTIDKWNKGKISMLLAHPASAGHGLNLQKGGSIIVWFGLTHSLELYEQFNGRLNRQGQTKPVRIIHLLIEGTIDNKIIKALQGKASVQNELIDYFKEITKKS